MNGQNGKTVRKEQGLGRVWTTSRAEQGKIANGLALSDLVLYTL